MSKIASFKVSMVPKSLRNISRSSGGAPVSPSYSHETKVAEKAINKALAVRARGR